MSRPPCRFFNSPGGCRRGNQCQYAHTRNTNRSNGPPTRPLSPNALSGGPARRNDRRQTQGASATAPRGVCKFYWEQGRCNREFECRLQHTRRDGVGQALAGPPPAAPTNLPTETALQRLAPFLTEQGLSKLNGGGTDGFFSPDASSSMTPSEAHNVLKRFLRDNFRLTTSFEVYSFLKTLSSASASNSSWTQEDGQLLLNTMASQNGLLLLIAIICWPQVSAHAGSSRDILSFQRGVIPLLRYLSSDFVVKSTLVSRANALFTEVLQNLPNLADTIEKSMTTIMASRSFTDPGPVAHSQNCQIGPQVFASISGALHECLLRFKNAVVIYPRLAPLITNLRLWFDEWANSISASPTTFDGPFQNVEPAVRDLLLGSIREKVYRLSSIVERELGKETRGGHQTSTAIHPRGGSNEGVIAALNSSYDPPGELRPGGPRHDNDFLDIYDVRVAPTHEELMCRLSPFLPASLFEAPHPAPPESMQRLLDIQFRLLREELTAPLRRAVQLVYDDLKAANRNKTKIGDILRRGGGKYHGLSDNQESIMFNVYTDVTFTSLIADRRGLSASLTVRTPPGRASSERAGARVAFWEGMSGKRLAQGGLIALVWETGSDTSIHLGIVASPLKDLTDHVRRERNNVKIRIVFFDSKVELRILQELRNRRSSFDGIKMLVESPVMFEAIRPFLEALKTEPEIIPFPRYLAFRPQGFLKTCTIDPPKYARLPGFSFQLSSLFPEEADVDDLRLNVSDEESIKYARAQLRHSSRLDPSQADAVVDVLIRELALLQGPPGTGKSFTGVELLRVLVENRVGPILMIAFTNHALDHLLCSVLDAGITKDIVRLGSRSSDERISQYSIETREMVSGQSRLDKTSATRNRALKDVQDEITKLMNSILKSNLESESSGVAKYVSTYYPEHHEHLANPPEWINIAKALAEGDTNGGQWQTQTRTGRAVVQDTSLYAYWKNCSDLDFLDMLVDLEDPPSGGNTDTVPQASSSNNRFEVLVEETGSDTDSSENDQDDDDDDDDDASTLEETDVEQRWMKVRVVDTADSDAVREENRPVPPVGSEPVQSDSIPQPLTASESYVRDPVGLFTALGYEGVPSIQLRDRILPELLDDGDIWALSRSERERLHTFWINEARIEMHQNQLDEFERLRKRHAERLEEYNECKQEVRRELLRDVDIIGCTTTGAAKLTTLLKALSPRVLLVEEAGQVLEAHVLGSLVPSVEHLILIGDPLQLRPTLNNFSLSMDSRRGRELYRFDMSLMERLSSSGLAMSRIDIQRRMRPSISSLIRNTLYPGLADHELVTQYPNVRGMSKNLFFVSHGHKENGGMDDTASKYNVYEVEMIRDLVLYLLRQGCYSAEGDIVVLCAYLGQLARLRDALAGEVAIVIDERDQAALADHEDEKDDDGDIIAGGTFEHVRVTKQVKLRTVDNFQGEEGKIVILSLVRNSGSLEDEMELQAINRHTKSNIGFLKSENRTNVALSRAREGLFIFGNADNLSSRSEMWRSIIDELEANDAIGPALPVACHRHREKVEYISVPGQLSRVAPDGGCLEACDARLKCGHLCPFKCHCDDPNHVAVICTQPCRKLCHRDHPCRKDCSSPCDVCMFPVPNVRLPCGHIKESVLCHQLDTIEDVFCDVEVVKQLPRCEHSAAMQCSQDPEYHRCKERCAEWLGCCSKSCNAQCYECQTSSPQPVEGPVKRTKHRVHPCQKHLHCEHTCQVACSEDHQHTTLCQAKCRQVCPHAKCQLPCSVPCAPCKEQCTWTCPHHSCPVPCGSVCARLPCDERCVKELVCGHRCPSVCGEDCSIQVCPECAPDERQTQVVDFIMQRTLSEVIPDLGSLDELLITIPSCLHTFTVETLDGHCGMSEFYRTDSDGRWLGLLAPSGFTRPPTCPTCRSVITAPRYGRVFKRADLDILERNVAAQTSRALEKVQTSMESFSTSAAKESLTKASATIDLKFQGKNNEKKSAAQAKARDTALRDTREAPISGRDINPANAKLHWIHPTVIDVWRKAMHPLLMAYKDAVEVAETRSAHTQAWEAALSCLHERELRVAMDAPKLSARQPMEHAMRVAKMQVGQSRPLADRRFLVEAIWSTIHIRLSLIDLTKVWLDEIAKRLQQSNTSIGKQQLSWATYIGFLLHSCIRDVDVAFKVASDSESHRQITKTALYQMRVKLEEFRFNLSMSKSTGLFKEKQHRDELAERAKQHRATSEEYMRFTIRKHREKKSSPEEMNWLQDNFLRVGRDIIDEWAKIEESIRKDTFYEPLSLDERMAIVKALEFTHVGHFYNCPNGHTFVIGECGGAMQVSRCPECDAVIGGSEHQLRASNTRASDFEELARQAGAHESPWPW